MQQQHSQELTSAAIAAMPYTTAVAREVLRLAQIVAYAPRVATRAVPGHAGSPGVPSGCPFILALSSISSADPAVAGDAEQLRPERWLDPANTKSLQQHQLPFGVGQHYCVGSNLAMAELTAVLAEVGRSWQVSLDDQDVEWLDFPIKRPSNGLPIRLQPLQVAETAQSVAA